MAVNKPRIVKDFEKLDSDLQEQIKLAYPEGFHNHLISSYDKDGQRRSALPFEAEDRYYLVRMSVSEAKQIIEEDTDYNEEGHLRPEVQEDYEEKYSGMGDEMSEDGEGEGEEGEEKEDEGFD